MDICELFTKDLNFKGTRGHTLKLKKPVGSSSSHRVIGRWNSLDQETVDASSINVFKRRLEN